MNSIIVLLIYVAVIGLVWLVPLYFICKWAEKQRKNYRLVGLVGLLTGWVIALVVALMLPRLGEAEFADLGRKAQREPLGETAIVLGGLGFCSVALLAFMAWMKWGL